MGLRKLIAKSELLRKQGHNYYYYYYYYYYCVRVLGGRGGWKKKQSKTNASRRKVCIKFRGSFLKNKFSMLSNSAEGQSGFNLVIIRVF